MGDDEMFGVIEENADFGWTRENLTLENLQRWNYELNAKIEYTPNTGPLDQTTHSFTSALFVNWRGVRVPASERYSKVADAVFYSDSDPLIMRDQFNAALQNCCFDNAWFTYLNNLAEHLQLRGLKTRQAYQDMYMPARCESESSWSYEQVVTQGKHTPVSSSNKEKWDKIVKRRSDNWTERWRNNTLEMSRDGVAAVKQRYLEYLKEERSKGRNPEKDDVYAAYSLATLLVLKVADSYCKPHNNYYDAEERVRRLRTFPLLPGLTTPLVGDGSDGGERWNNDCRLQANVGTWRHEVVRHNTTEGVDPARVQSFRISRWLELSPKAPTNRREADSVEGGASRRRSGAEREPCWVQAGKVPGDSGSLGSEVGEARTSYQVGQDGCVVPAPPSGGGGGGAATFGRGYEEEGGDDVRAELRQGEG
jgi:hypothetical protein